VFVENYQNYMKKMFVAPCKEVAAHFDKIAPRGDCCGCRCKKPFRKNLKNKFSGGRQK
jgi:hypothetical protein